MGYYHAASGVFGEGPSLWLAISLEEGGMYVAYCVRSHAAVARRVNGIAVLAAGIRDRKKDRIQVQDQDRAYDDAE